MTDEQRRPGKRVDLRETLSAGRRRAGGDDDGEGEPPPAGSTVATATEERATERSAAQQPAEPAAAPPAATPPPTRPAAPPVDLPATGKAEVVLVAFYVRLPDHLKDKVDQASFELRAMKATNQELIAALIDQEVEPTTPAGRAALTRRLERYRRRVMSSG
jgi:hypothetical protein